MRASRNTWPDQVGAREGRAEGATGHRAQSAVFYLAQVRGWPDGVPGPPRSRRFGMKVLVRVLMLVAALGGCGSYQTPSAAFTPEAECARNGGRWRPGIGGYAFCDIKQ